LDPNYTSKSGEPLAALIDASYVFSRLMSSRDLVVDAGPNANILWQRLVSLFNTLNFNDNKYKMNTNMSQALLRCRAAISSKPISEDFQSRGIKFFEKRQQSLHWKDQEFLSSYDLVYYTHFQYMRTSPEY
jgi:hypothetical protein